MLPYRVVPRASKAPFLLTCEHASSRIPAPFTLPDCDQWLLTTHWAYDLGAAKLTQRLAEISGAPAVFAEFSRLLVDPNRDLTSETLFRSEAEGKAIALNAGLARSDKEQRLALLYAPFHQAIARVLEADSHAQTVFAIHSFTPTYDGLVRDLEVGVLWNRDDDLGLAMLDWLLKRSYSARGNEPYSGKDGLIHVAETHAASTRKAIELEVRQDRLEDDAFVTRLVTDLAAFGWPA